ncbi:MAG: hypothetical protein IID08_02790 [Candidatus Hydrogenedentes bacterium]|nr:hypothetical protein [Candidatus Hydrogenedentota bacterium]
MRKTERFSSHPSKHDLLTHAERLTDRVKTVNANVALHLGACGYCRAEVDQAIRVFQLAGRTESIEPSRESHARLLLAARNERRILRERPAWRAVFSVRGLACAVAGMLLVAVALGTARDTREQERLGTTAITMRPMSAGLLSFERLRHASPEEEVLGAAIRSSLRAPSTEWEREQIREAGALDSDIEEALIALRNNPACVRAGELVRENRDRLKATLTKLYVERNL